VSTETTTDLPTWDEMADVDKGCALLHLHKRDWEGNSYAVREYPCEYLDDPRLTALTPQAACRHAVTVGGSNDEAFQRLGQDEYERLYNLALDEPDRRCLWGARYPTTTLAAAGGAVATTSYSPAPRHAARELVKVWADNGHGNAAVMHRSEPGGEWHEVGGCDGCRVEG